MHYNADLVNHLINLSCFSDLTDTTRNLRKRPHTSSPVEETCDGSPLTKYCKLDNEDSPDEPMIEDTQQVPCHNCMLEKKKGRQWYIFANGWVKGAPVGWQKGSKALKLRSLLIYPVLSVGGLTGSSSLTVPLWLRLLKKIWFSKLCCCVMLCKII